MIMGGVVSYEDGVKHDPKDQYSLSRKVRVELNFAVPEDPGVDPDSVLAEVMEKAINLTNEKLGIKTATRSAKSTTVAPAPTGKTKADLEAEALAKAEAPKAPGAKRGPGRPKAGPPPDKTEDWDTGNAADTVGKPETAASATDAQATDEWAADPVVEITDADLNKAVGEKNGTLKDPPKIRALIGSFNPNPKKPFNLRDIPKEQRQTFLDKLKELA